jgi:hypothetical protein
MALTEQDLKPVAVALHTRDREEDYHWYPGTGLPKLTSRLRELHRVLIADLDAKPASPATFLLLEEADRIALLIGNLKTNRTDHMNTRIDDAIVMEFEREQRSTVYLLAAELLGPSSSLIQQSFLNYAEDCFQQREINYVPKFRVTLPAKRGGSDEPSTHQHVAMRANEANCRRVAALLEKAADDPAYFKEGVLIVCTGYVGLAKLQQFVPQVQRLIALSRSSSIPDDEAIALSASDPKKNSPSIVVPVVLVIVLVCGMLGILLWTLSANFIPTPMIAGLREQVEHLEQRVKRLEEYNEYLRQQVRVLKNGSLNSKPGRAPHRNLVLRAAAIVGLGSAPHGQGGPAVAASLASEAKLKPGAEE